MAQIDTGLGWSAKDSWLMAGSGIIATIPGGFHWNISGFETQQIPVTPATQSDVVAGGLLECDYVAYGARYRRYLGANKPGALIAVFHDGQLNPYRTVIYVPDDTYEVYEQRMEGTHYQDDLSIVRTWYRTMVGTDTITYTGGTGSGIIIDPSDFFVPQFPLYSTVEACAQAGWAYIVQSADIEFSKDNSGYATVCVANWYTTTGTLITSPVLISSDPDAVEMSCDSASFNFAKTSFLYDGKRFYMGFWDAVNMTYESTAIFADLTQFGAAALEKVFNLLRDESFANILLTEAPPDPYEEQTDPSGEDGGEGEDPEDDPVDEETLPLPAVVGLGFATIYVPTQTDLFNLASYLWGGNLDLDSFLKLFANPMDSILGLSAVPLVLSGTYEPIYLGGQLLQGITMPRYTGRTAVKVDMGTATIKERWGAYLDYDPYTELAVYVPFVGIKNIKADDVMGKTIRLMYDIDILSGACIAYIRPEGGSPLYEWSGQCAMQIPITGANWDNIFSTAINTVATLGGALFAPASAPVLGGAVASAATQAIAAKPRIERSGAVNGITGFLGQLRPYIIRAIPEAYIPNDQNKFIGYPSYVSVNLGSLSGYNEIASIHLENIPATGDELAELESILKGGVIF